MAHDVFISYSSDDKTTADAICESIEAAGLSCWIAPRNIRAGDTWGSAIINAISESRAMVLILSGSANGSRQVLREAERAVQKDVVLIPVRVEEIDPSPGLEYFVSATHWYDAYQPPLENHLQPIADIVKSVVEEQLGAKVKEQHPKTISKDSAPKPAAMLSTKFGTKTSENRHRNKIIFSILTLIVVGAIGFVLWNTDFFLNGDLLTKEGQELAAPESVTAAGEELKAPGGGLAAPESATAAGGELKVPKEGLAAPKGVTAGSVFKVAWTGPNNSGDFITIVKADAAEKTYINYAYTKDGNPAKLRALDEPGAYELRYIMGQSRATLARAPILVRPAKATLQKTD